MQLLEIETLKQGKNLLGFSGGLDSSALFFMLMQHNIAFDIAIVDYGIRTQSKEEVAYAHTLAKTFAKRCFSIKAPRFSHNFEAKARAFRYHFFSAIMTRHNYNALLLAHHFNDRFEWFLLQLSKGAGIDSLLGFDAITWMYPNILHHPRQTQNLLQSKGKPNARLVFLGDNTTQNIKKPKAFYQDSVPYKLYHPRISPYRIIRPMLSLRKQDILGFCTQHHIHFFEDVSNEDTTYKRNFIRMHFANDFIEYFNCGVQRSFTILKQERMALYHGVVAHLGNFTFIIADTSSQALHLIAKTLKLRGYVLSQNQRQEIAKTHFSCTVGPVTTSLYARQNFLIERLHLRFFTMFETDSTYKTNGVFPKHLLAIIIIQEKSSTPSALPKTFKNLARIYAIPPRLRPSLYDHLMRYQLETKMLFIQLYQVFWNLYQNAKYNKNFKTETI